MCLIFQILSTYCTFQVSARKVRSGGKGQDQDQEAAVVANNIEKVGRMRDKPRKRCEIMD